MNTTTSILLNYIIRKERPYKQIIDKAWVVGAEEFSNCLNEQKFKMQFIKKYLSDKQTKAFCIETEETYGGFPDVLLLEKGNFVTVCNPVRATLLEFKFADKSGAITFKPTQPAFYKKYNWLDTFVIAYNGKSERVHVFLANHLRDVRSPYFTDGKARINLSKIEKEAGLQ